MAQKVVVIDSSLLVVWLKVPGRQDAGPKHDLWDFDRIDAMFRKNQEEGATFVLPVATIIETGNMICGVPKKEDRLPPAQALVELITSSGRGVSPWAIFSDQSVLWESDQLIRIVEKWPELTGRSRCVSMGDATIKVVAEHYAKMGFHVEIATGDFGLKSFQPPAPVVVPTPRRRP
ncbi:MAG: hypothetical protein HQL51_04395 [Magnetococcales bacterium]|nr:hypothetical protein [Magnetococcales bacterium]